MRFLAISGSLRVESKNTAVLKEIMVLAPVGIQIELYTGLASLPHFNPDLEENFAVRDFREQLQIADAVIICSPEYAHGVPGSLKNALDWVVSSGELMEKPVALVQIGLSSFAHDQLLEILQTIMASVLTFKVPVFLSSSEKNVLFQSLMVALKQKVTRT